MQLSFKETADCILQPNLSLAAKSIKNLRAEPSLDILKKHVRLKIGIYENKEGNMFNSQKFDEVAKKLSDMVPDRIKGLSDDLQKNFRSVLQSSFSKMDLVTREEFDVQTKVLAKTRAKLEELEQKMAVLEAQLIPNTVTPPKTTDSETIDLSKDDPVL